MFCPAPTLLIGTFRVICFVGLVAVAVSGRCAGTTGCAGTGGQEREKR